MTWGASVFYFLSLLLFLCILYVSLVAWNNKRYDDDNVFLKFREIHTNVTHKPCKTQNFRSAF